MATYKGTSGNDTLAGSSGADSLQGLGGDDLYIVNNLGDVVVEAAGAGIDTINTSVLDALGEYSIAAVANVENITWTGALAAMLTGNALDNVIRANQSAATADVLSGGRGDDQLFGYGGSDRLLGGTGNDMLDGGTGADMLLGGAGNDTYVIDDLGDRIYETRTQGSDTVLSAVLADLRATWARHVENLTWTGAAATTLYGNAGDNVLQSNAAGADTLYGLDGNDTLIGGAGVDTLIGGLGNDIYQVTADDVVVEARNAGIDTIVGTRTSLATSDLALTVENLVYTGATAATLTGNGLGNLVIGGDGADSISGVAGNDVVVGGGGADKINAGSGDDILIGGRIDGLIYTGTAIDDGAADVLSGSTGDDRYLIGALNDRVVETATGGTFDVVQTTVNTSLARYAYLEALVIEHGAAAWSISGSTGNDVLVGNEQDNTLTGGDGNDLLSPWARDPGEAGQADLLDGGAGNDVFLAYDFTMQAGADLTLLGGLGDDLYIVGTSAEIVGFDEGGNDTVVFVGNGGTGGVEGVENFVLYGGGNSALDARVDAAFASVLRAAAPGTAAPSHASLIATTVTGNDGDNTITGNNSGNTLSGGFGDDTIIGNGGSDTLRGDAGDDTLDGGQGTDRLEGGDGQDTLSGGGIGDQDVLISGAGDDTLYSGTSGTIGDVLWGDDPLSGGAAGADRFIIDAVTAENGLAETFTGSGVFTWPKATLIRDFAAGVDTLGLLKDNTGNLDTVINGAVSVDSGTFSAAAELVFFRKNVAADFSNGDTANPILAAPVDAVIGSADAPIAPGAGRIFVVDDGTDSAVFQFVSNNGDANVDPDELYLLGIVQGQTALTAADLFFI